MTTLAPNTPLHAVKSWLRKQLDVGTECPACHQHVQLYRRKINSGMARSLIAMYRVNGTDWVHVPTMIGARSREEGKLAYWGLVEEEKAKRPDNGRAGYWRVTPRGEEFIKRQMNVPKYALVYNGRVQGFDTTTMVSIKDALGTKFDYAELMVGL